MAESRAHVPDRHVEHLNGLAEVLCGIVASDRAGRKAPLLCVSREMVAAAEVLFQASSVTIVTGFLVPEAGKAETDGPPGSAVLGRAIRDLDKKCRIVTDPYCLDVVSACAKAVGGPEVVPASAPEEVLEGETDCLVFVERLGQAADGRYYNMRGRDITEWTSPLDCAAGLARRKGIPVVAIGDGGNEAGMGTLAESLKGLVPDFGPCLCAVDSDVCLPVDVSNWGCYAVVALLSGMSGRWMGHSPLEESAMLEGMIEAGGVDGATRRRVPTVDGFTAEENLAVVERVLRAWLDACPAGAATFSS